MERSGSSRILGWNISLCAIHKIVKCIHYILIMIVLRLNQRNQLRPLGDSIV